MIKSTYNYNSKIILIFSDGLEISYDKELINSFSQNFLLENNNFNNKIKLPLWMEFEDLSTFILICQKGLSYITENTDIVKILKTSEFFNNDAFSCTLLSNLVIPKLTIENSLILLVIGYEKLSEASKNNENIDNIWFEFFIKALDIVGKNLNYYFKTHQFQGIKTFDSKILDELFEKFCAYLISSSFYFTNEPKQDTLKGNYIYVGNLKEMIKYLQQYRSQGNFFDLLSNEYMKICSEDNINELNDLPNPTFSLKLNRNEIETYYEEYKIDISLNRKQIILIIFYRKSDDSFNVGFKLTNEQKFDYEKNMHSFRIVTFISSVSILEINNRQINIRSISNNKSMHVIFKLNNIKNVFNFTNINNPINEYVTLKIYLKPCFIHSVLTSYFLYNFADVYNGENISKISKQLLILVLKNKNYVNLNENNVVQALLNWRKF